MDEIATEALEAAAPEPTPPQRRYTDDELQAIIDGLDAARAYLPEELAAHVGAASNILVMLPDGPLDLDELSESSAALLREREARGEAENAAITKDDMKRVLALEDRLFETALRCHLLDRHDDYMYECRKRLCVANREALGDDLFKTKYGSME